MTLKRWAIIGLLVLALAFVNALTQREFRREQEVDGDEE